jgi:hypothetical protein
MAGGRRVDGAGYAARINAAADLAGAGVPAAEAARMLAGRLGCSVRQARRYVDQAAAGGRVRVPEASTVFTVKLPAGLAGRVRAQAREAGITISALVAQALEEFLSRGRRNHPGR